MQALFLAHSTTTRYNIQSPHTFSLFCPKDLTGLLSSTPAIILLL